MEEAAALGLATEAAPLEEDGQRETQAWVDRPRLNSGHMRSSAEASLLRC